ncbi:MAG: hypothetical protein WHS88_10055 [Anaerohalosphaeraceae bacterium]
MSDQNDFIGWNQRCDLNEDYLINLDDLAEFAEEPCGNWGWIACWKRSRMNRLESPVDTMMSGRGQESITELMLRADFPKTSLLQEAEEPDPAVLERNIQLILEEVERYIIEQPENVESLVEMKVFLEEMLWDLNYTESKEGL